MSTSNESPSEKPADPPPVDVARGAIPKEPIRGDSITKFDRGAGDSSRALLWIVLAFGAVAILGILLFTTYKP